MPGQFSKSARPIMPGAYFNWIASVPNIVPPSVGSIVCIPFTSDWGPFKTPVLVGSFQEYLGIFGPTIGTPGYNAVWQAFTGEGGFDGRYGAGAVLCYRFGAAAAAKATKALSNTTPAVALTLSAKYEGSYGNNITVTTQDHAADTTQNEILIFVSGQLVETYSYLDVNIADAAAQINARSNWVTAVSNITGVALANVAAQAFTTGNDGTATIASDYVAVQSALETQQFGVLCPYGLTDAPTLVALKAWAGGASGGANGRNAKGQRFEVVTGGPADELASVAVARALTLNDGNFATVGMGHIVDSGLLDVNGNAVTLAPSQWAARVAGVLAQRGEAMSLTFARFPGVTLLNGAIDADIATCLLGGVMVLANDSDPDAPVHIVSGRTTFVNGAPNGPAANAAFPYTIYRNPKFMRTMQNIEGEWTQWANSTIIGRLPVNNKTRDAAVANMQSRLRAREQVGIIQPGWTVGVDLTPPPSDNDEFIALAVGLLFGRSVEQVYFSVNVG